MKQTMMRRFYLQRDEDATGTSGIGKVAEGVEFQCGRVCLTWLSHYGCVSTYDNMRVVQTLHGHEGRTRVVWIDDGIEAPTVTDTKSEYKRVFLAAWNALPVRPAKINTVDVLRMLGHTEGATPLQVHETHKLLWGLGFERVLEKSGNKRVRVWVTPPSLLDAGAANA